MSFVKKLAGETVIYGMSSILPRVIYFLFITTYITYRFPDTYDYGLYSELYAYSTIILVFFVFRMDTAFFRFGANSEDQNAVFGTATLPVLLITSIGVIVMLFFSEKIAEILEYSGDGYYIRWFAFILGFDALTAMFYARFRIQSRPYRFLFYKITNVLITLFFVFLFLEILPRLGVEWIAVNRLIDYVFLANLIGSTAILVMMLPDILEIKWRFDRPMISKMMLYSLPLVLVGFAGQINQTFAVPLQRFFLGASYTENLTIAGAYAGPARIALLLNLFTVAFNYAAEPFFFNNAGKKDSDKAYGQILHAFTIASGMAMLGIVCFQELVVLLIGESYRGTQEIIPILLFANFFLGLYYNISIWYKLSDKTIYGAYISIGGAIITLIISIALLPRIGYLASALAALACYAFMLIAGYISGQKFYPIVYPVKTILALILFFFVVMTGTIFGKSMIESDMTNLVIGSMVFVTASFIIILWQKEYIKSYLK